MFNITVSDLEGDAVTVRISFGDGATDQIVLDDLEPQVGANVSFEHSYDKGGDYVVDVTADDGKDHSDPDPARRTATVVVKKESFLNLMTIAIVIGIVAVIVAIAVILMRKRGGSKPSDLSGESGGMEGMTVSETDTPPPPT